MNLEATEIKPRRWAVRPVGALGTHGWINGEPWQVEYVTAPDQYIAIQLARKAMAAGARARDYMIAVYQSHNKPWTF